MAEEDEMYRRRVSFIQRLRVNDPDEYLRFCSVTAHLTETDAMPDHLVELRDTIAAHLRDSSHRPLGLDTSQWINDEWMRDLWFDVFGPEPVPDDPYPVPGDDWGSVRWTPFMHHLAAHGAHDECDLDQAAATWFRTHRVPRGHATPSADDPTYRPEPDGYHDRLDRLIHDGTRRAMPGEKQHPAATDLAALLEADDHDIWWNEAKRLQAITDEAATALGVTSPAVVHLCPGIRLDRRHANRGSPAGLRSTRRGWRPRRRRPRHVQLALARQMAAEPDSVARGIIGHEMAHLAISPARRRRRRYLIAGVYVAILVAVTVAGELLALSMWEKMPIALPAAVGLVIWLHWMKRREESACDVLAASIGMPITNRAATWMDDNFGSRAPRWVQWLAAPWREHPSWPSRLKAIRRATLADRPAE